MINLFLETENKLKPIILGTENIVKNKCQQRYFAYIQLCNSACFEWFNITQTKPIICTNRENDDAAMEKS